MNEIKIRRLKIRLIGTSSTKCCLETVGGTESGTAVADKRFKISNI